MTSEKPPRGSDRELWEVSTQIVELLSDRDPVQVERILATVKTFYPSKIRISPSPNVGAMP